MKKLTIALFMIKGHILDTILKYNVYMMNIKKKIEYLILLSLLLIPCISIKTMAAKYTIASGIDFNTRIKMAINPAYTSATPDATITGFTSAYNIPEGKSVIDISEDGDGSVLAYIDHGVIYYVCDDEIYLNYDASYMFDKFLALQNVNLSELNFSKTRKMSYMFGSCKYLTNIDMDNDTTIKINEMQGMFFDCESLEYANIYMIDTKNVSNMSSLFCNCKNLKNIQIDIYKWSTLNVSNVSSMFLGCESLKTNFGRKAIDIPETSYKVYARAGNDDLEGLLKDFDYEYDDYGANDKKIKVDNTLVDSIGNKNIITSLSASVINNARQYANVDVASDSVFSEQYANASIGKGGKKKLSERLISQTVAELPTVDGVPILLDETTEIDLESMRKKMSERDKALDRDIADEEIDVASLTELGGILRPNYIDATNDTSIDDTKSTIDNNMTINTNDSTLIYVIIGMIAVIFISVIFSFARFKKDGGGEFDGSE